LCLKGLQSTSIAEKKRVFIIGAQTEEKKRALQ